MIGTYFDSKTEQPLLSNVEVNIDTIKDLIKLHPFLMDTDKWYFCSNDNKYIKGGKIKFKTPKNERKKAIITRPMTLWEPNAIKSVECVMAKIEGTENEFLVREENIIKIYKNSTEK